MIINVEVLACHHGISTRKYKWFKLQFRWHIENIILKISSFCKEISIAFTASSDKYQEKPNCYLKKMTALSKITKRSKWIDFKYFILQNLLFNSNHMSTSFAGREFETVVKNMKEKWRTLIPGEIDISVFVKIFNFLPSFFPSFLPPILCIYLAS